MRIRMTNCPKAEKAPPVSRTINPVSLVAEVAVKRALIKPILLPLLEAAGRLRSKAPVVIIKRYPNNIICGGDNLNSLIAGVVIIVEMVSHLFLVNF
jgi:hypothetical protein